MALRFLATERWSFCGRTPPSSLPGEFVDLAADLSPAVAPAAFVAALVSGNTHFNIHTSRYPSGGIRGQIFAVPEPSTWALPACNGGSGVVWRSQVS